MLLRIVNSSIENRDGVVVIESGQQALENHLLDSGIVNRRELDLAKKIQQAKQGPLPILLWQLSFITLYQLSALLDWSGQVS